MNPPEDQDDRKATMLEQWWPGLLCLAVWVIWVVFGAIVMRSCVSCASGGEVRLKWDQPPGGPEIIQWNIYRTYPLPRTQIGVSEEPHITLDANEGDHIVVTAVSYNAESGDSVALIVRFPMSDPITRVTIQSSSDLTTWENYQSFDMRESKARFFRLKIEPPKPP